MKGHLLLGRKAMTNLYSILKSRDITLLTKVHIIKAMIFPVIMYRCESWTIKKAECWRIGAFELWCWGRLMRVPRTARWSKQSILKEINPEYSLEGLMLKLKLQYFGHLLGSTDSLMLGNTFKWLSEKTVPSYTPWWAISNCPPLTLWQGPCVKQHLALGLAQR